ncbi:MAG: condensation domain-containing protein, partial [Candidatus Latescibacterota bacterium]
MSLVEAARRPAGDLPAGDPAGLWRAAKAVVAARQQGPPLERRTRDEDLPLSCAQERVWLLQQLEPGTPAYNEPFAFRLGGPLDVEVLARCLQEIARRHEVLRTTFADVASRPTQIVGPEGSVALRTIDLRDSGLAELEAEALRLAAQEAARPFDLACEPPLRATLVRLGPQLHILSVVAHQLAFDHPSRNLFTRELAALYGAFRAGRPSPLAELSVQYADYALWQQQQGAALESQLAYWERQLGAGVAGVELPADRPRPAAESYRGQTRYFEVPKAQTEALRQLGRQQGVTLYVALVAAFKALLVAYTGQEDILVISSAAGRTHPETPRLIGFFANLIAL